MRGKGHGKKQNHLNEEISDILKYHRYFLDACCVEKDLKGCSEMDLEGISDPALHQSAMRCIENCVLGGVGKAGFDADTLLIKWIFSHT